MKTFDQSLAKVVVALCEDADTARSLSVAICIRYNAFDSLLEMRVNPRDYITAESYYKDNVVVNLLSKCEDLPVKADPNAQALRTWCQSETDCYRTNVRLMPYIMNGPFEDLNDIRISDYLDVIRRYFRDLLGGLPPDLYHAKLGPGSTVSDKGLFATVPDKFTSRPTINSKARCLLPLWENTAWARALMNDSPHRYDPLEVNSDNLVFVPKKATTSRCISIGPSLSVYFQLGVGRHLRQRLRKVGIDLEIGQELHSQVACVSSRDDTFVTIDLKSASDSVSRNVVRLFASDAWYELLDSLRMPSTVTPTGVRHLQKFSAMGNGYTFELETSLFLCIAMAAYELSGEVGIPGVNVFIYGDDIIVSKSASVFMIPLLKFLGFSLNQEKSFVEGPFRESCGGDFFDGQPVRAHYLNSQPKEPHEWIALANGLRRLSAFYGDGHLRWLKRAWFYTISQLPVAIRRLRVPNQLGDLGVNDNVASFDPSVDSTSPTGTIRVRNGIRYFKVWSPVVKPIPLYHWKPWVILAAALYGVPSDGPIPRGSVAGYRFSYVPSS